MYTTHARNLYTLDFNKDAMFDKLGEQKKVDNLIFKIRESMPLKIEINRDLENCKEKLIQMQRILQKLYSLTSYFLL